MPTASANGITLEYDTFGTATNPPVLLIMGLGAQMTLWDPQFCDAIAQRGFFVIRFDNRDVGLSTWFDDAGTVDVRDVISGKVAAPYSLSDMAADAAGLLDALGIPAAHIVGASMGGMIAQTFAIEHPDKTLTLTSIMSTTGNREVGQPSPEALSALLGPVPTSKVEAIERGVAVSRVIGSPGFEFNEARIKERAASDFDRAFHPAGMARQLAAINVQPDRTTGLGTVTAPTLVIHGADDPLVTPSGGQATADAVTGSTLKMIPGMGHDLPEPLWGEIVDSLVQNFSRAAS